MNQTFVEYGAKAVHVLLPSNKYVDKVLRSKSFEELWPRFIDAESPTKEISESYAALFNLKKICNVEANTWLHIGDGGYTRTAAIFAFFTKSLNISIDPALNINKYEDWWNKVNPKGILAYASMYENLSEAEVDTLVKLKMVEDDKAYFPKYSICLVHAHVNIHEVDKHYPNWQYLYTNPCCNPETQMFKEDYMKEHGIVKVVDKLDLAILSDKRRVSIYKKLPQKCDIMGQESV